MKRNEERIADTFHKIRSPSYGKINNNKHHDHHRNEKKIYMHNIVTF